MGKEPIKKTYVVEYQASYRVEAPNEEEAIKKAMAIHEKSPDGIWGGYLESYEFYREDSKLSWD